MKLTPHDRPIREPEAPLRRDWQRWQQDEEAFLRQRYGDWPTERIARHIGRSVYAIHDKARRMGLVLKERQALDERTRRREALLRAIQYHGSQSALARFVGVSPGFINLCAHDLKPVPAHIIEKIQTGGDE